MFVAVKFDETLRNMTPAEFVDEVARVFPDLKQVAIGEGWSFGKNRAGNADRLAALADKHGFSVTAIAPVMLDGAPVSSTRIREAIAQREFDEAARLLGRSYAVTGKVVHGDERGAPLAFPPPISPGSSSSFPRAASTPAARASPAISRNTRP